MSVSPAAHEHATLHVAQDRGAAEYGQMESGLQQHAYQCLEDESIAGGGAGLQFL
jgi:hypothetical protein